MLIHQRNHLLPFTFLLLASILASVKAQPIRFCYNNGNYTNSSTYGTNLRTLLSNLSANVDQNGYYHGSVGQSSNTTNAVALCRGDTQLGFCRSCIENATDALIQACPNRMQAILWDEFCMLRYSNASLDIGTMDTAPVTYLYNTQNSTRPADFMTALGSLSTNITGQASNGGSSRKVGYGSLPTVGLQTIRALVQCTPDLSAEDCSSCLNSAIQVVPRNIFGAIGARILQPSCNLRYEVRPFYNETRLQELQPMAPPPPALLAPPPVASPPPPGNGNNSDNTTLIIIIVVATVVGIVILILIGFLIWRKYQKKPKEQTEIVEGGDDISIIESLQYEFSVIQSATNNFAEANKLGQGGFGSVYKGKLPNGQEIAVKRLSIGSGQGDLEFKNEVVLLAKLQHRNLVRLFGFSLQGQEKLLVYEFVQNASLDQFIFDPTRSSQLDWTVRYKIIGGIARGILYLHEDSRVRIIHRDLKASNVLLDGEMNPKIADFGMARLYVPDETVGNTSRIVGTYGYMAPEYASRGQFSVKSDVYSFGVILLEIISGLKNNCARDGETGEDLISSAWGNWHGGNAANLVDPVLRVGAGIQRDILRCIHIGLLCVQENPAQRPTMATIVIMLNSYSITLPVPSPPAFCLHGGSDSESALLQESNSIEGSFSKIPTKFRADESGDSTNEMSITEFEPR